MDSTTRAMLNGSEQAIIRLIESKKFAKLDEDELLDLHARTRRARTKYATLIRRRGAKGVGKHGSRAVATKATRRTAAKAELFEGALATVSARLAKVAAANAKALRDDRLKAARATKSATKTAKKVSKRAPSKRGKASRGSTKTKTPASKRARAAKRAANQRTQVKRDKR